MVTEHPSPEAIEAFIARWGDRSGTEKSNSQLFLTELIALLGLPAPDPAGDDNELNAYVFERRVDIDRPDGSSTRGFIDLYRRGCFVLEAEQSGRTIDSSGWDRAMLAAQNQADQYVRALPRSARSTHASAINSAPTTPRAPTSSGWSCPRLLSRCVPSGRPHRSLPRPGCRRASRTTRWGNSPTSTTACARSACSIRACGSANFLYVSLEHMKRLEGEVLNLIRDLSSGQTRLDTEGLTVDPHQLLGLEINPRAAAIAEIVLWIGYLQWYFRLHGKLELPEPILRDFHNIECRDALIDYDAREPVTDQQGEPVTIWDGISYKESTTTGELIPDESGQTTVYRYINPRKAEWPEADYIVGNPPFIGASTMR